MLYLRYQRWEFPYITLIYQCWMNGKHKYIYFYIWYTTIWWFKYIPYKIILSSEIRLFVFYVVNENRLCSIKNRKRILGVLWCFVHICFVQVTILKLVRRSRRADAPRCAHFPIDICSVIQEGKVEKCMHRGASARRERHMLSLGRNKHGHNNSAPYWEVKRERERGVPSRGLGAQTCSPHHHNTWKEKREYNYSMTQLAEYWD